MASRSNASLASLLLTQRLVDGPVQPLKASEYWAVLDAVADPADLLGLDPAGVQRLAGTTTDLAERVAALLATASAFAFSLEEFERSGLRAVPSVDDAYPAALLARLGRSAPPIVYLAGDPSLLTSPSLGIVGSRDIGEEAADAAKDAARRAVEHGWSVVSGGAKGADRLAMTSAHEAGGRVSAVLADSLNRTLRDPDVRRAVTDDVLCLCSPYKPSAGFSVANAMGRNKIIYALSQATLVVSCEEGKGGTWAGATEALKRKLATVWVWTGEGAPAGNHALVALGARPVETVDDLELVMFEVPSSEPPAQLSLGLGHSLGEARR